MTREGNARNLSMCRIVSLGRRSQENTALFDELVMMFVSGKGGYKEGNDVISLIFVEYKPRLTFLWVLLDFLVPFGVFEIYTSEPREHLNATFIIFS